MDRKNLHNCTIRFFANGQATVLYLKDNLYRFYVDMEGGQSVHLQDGMLHSPIESIDHFKHYKTLPERSILRYFNELTQAVYEAEPSEDQRLDICKLQQKILSERWLKWINKGFVSDKEEPPFVLQAMGVIKPKKESFWKW